MIKESYNVIGREVILVTEMKLTETPYVILKKTFIYLEINWSFIMVCFNLAIPPDQSKTP